MARSWTHRRRDRDDRVRVDRQGRAAADRAPFQIRQAAFHRHRSRRFRSRLARRARHQVFSYGGYARKLPRAARQVAHRRRRPGLLRQPVGRHLLARHHAFLPRDRRALYRHRHRAVARLLFRQVARRERALQLRVARDRHRRAARPSRRRRPRFPAAGPIRAWSRGSSSRGWSTSPRTSETRRPNPRRAKSGERWRKNSASRASISPSATPSAPNTPSRATCSSTPGRSRAFCRKACSRPSSAGARTKNGRRPTRASKRKAAAPRSTCYSQAPTPACAHGRRRRRPNTDSWSPTTSRSRSPTILPSATTRARRSIGRPAITPIIPATTRC